MISRYTIEQAKLKKSINKLTKFLISSQTYVRKRQASLKEAREYIEAIHSQMKNCLNNLNTSKICRINAPAKKFLLDFFENLFRLLYIEEKDVFSWKDFKIKVLLKNKGQDFQSTLAHFDFKNITKKGIELANKIIDNKNFCNFLERDTSGEYLIDLHAWVMYIPVGAEKYKDMKQAERNVKQIKEDVIKRTVRKETEQQIYDSQQASLRSIEGYYQFAQ